MVSYEMSPRGARGPRAVALGGGHGLSATLAALRMLTRRITAIVTVADDGGSSGRLRRELGVLPPGDLRMALAALCDDGEWGQLWRDVLQHRFASDGPLDGHSLGNLLICALWDILEDPVEGLDFVARLLGASGKVIPMAAEPLEIEASVGEGDGKRTVRGQVAVATTFGAVHDVRLIPPDPAIRPEAPAALAEADLVVMGPGSWYSSVLPHLLVPQLHQALIDSPARRVLVLNLCAQEGETEGMTSADHLRVFAELAGDLRIDVVIADPSAVDDLQGAYDCARSLGANLVLRQVGVSGGHAVHDPLRLAAALRDVTDGVLGDVEK